MIEGRRRINNMPNGNFKKDKFFPFACCSLLFVTLLVGCAPTVPAFYTTNICKEDEEDCNRYFLYKGKLNSYTSPYDDFIEEIDQDMADSLLNTKLEKVRSIVLAKNKKDAIHFAAYKRDLASQKEEAFAKAIGQFADDMQKQENIRKCNEIKNSNTVCFRRQCPYYIGKTNANDGCEIASAMEYDTCMRELRERRLMKCE